MTFTTADGVTITGDLASPTDGPPSRAAIVCHPHPQYGGDRFNSVVEACWRGLADVGVGALRFDFRAIFGGGVAERQDAVAALDVLAARWPDAALAVVGYSFGAMVALGLGDPRVAASVLIAPPLTVMPLDVTPVAPMLVLVPAHDQFTRPADAMPVVEAWRADGSEVGVEAVEMADHFLTGRVAHVAERTVTWLTGLPDV
ncbi:MAG: hypothetical protein AAFP84_18940 [Actinomycetota bacterium]